MIIDMLDSTKGHLKIYIVLGKQWSTLNHI